MYMIEIVILNNYYVPRAVTLKVGKPELGFLCSAHSFMVLYICEKFHEYIWNGFQLTERTQVYDRNGYAQCSNSNISKSRQTRVTVHKFCTSSHRALNLCEHYSKHLKRFLTYRAATGTWLKLLF